MKKLYILLILALSCMAQNTNAQNYCSNPFTFTTGTTYTFPLQTGTVNSDSTNDYGCLATTPNPMWLYFKVCTPGSLQITLNPVGGSGVDVDFVAWGPLSAATDCGLDSSQIVDCSYATGPTETVNITGALVGQYYKIMVSNFSDQPGTLSVSQTSGPGVACDSTGAACSPLTVQPVCQVTTNAVSNYNTIIWNKDDTTYAGTFVIQKESTTMGVYTTIATIVNNDTSAYTDTTSNAMVQAFQYRIQVADTCGHTLSSAFHRTIHLITTTSPATGNPQLSWNAYVGFGYGTYYIFRGTTPSTLSLYDSISASTMAYTDVAPVSGMNYYSIGVTPPTACHPSRSVDMGYSYSNTSAALVTGITETSFSDLIISPNPASNEISFTTENNHFSSINFEIYDVTGRILVAKQYENTSSAKVDVSDLANGYYVVRFATDKGATQRNIIIAK